MTKTNEFKMIDFRTKLYLAVKHPTLYLGPARHKLIQKRELFIPLSNKLLDLILVYTELTFQTRFAFPKGMVKKEQ